VNTIVRNCFQIQKFDLLESLPLDGAALSTNLHQGGLNVRLLGLAAGKTKLPHVRESILSDIAARVTKMLLHRFVSETLLQ
jgi:hypothetical protein